MIATWFVIGHRAGMRIFERDGDVLQMVSELKNEAGRLKSGEIDSDRAGFSFDRGGQGRHPMNTEESAHEHRANTFAREIASLLQDARNAHRYSRLVLVAEPKFLGMLKGALDGATASLIGATLGKDLAKIPAHELASHLKEVL
jgi:protein required for attachment to host cells